MQKYLSFTVGGLDLGVDMTSVVSIEQGGALAGENPGELKPGTVSFGGQVLPLYNVSGLLGRKGSDLDRGFDSKVLIVSAASGTIAMWVDRVGSVIEAIENTVSELPPVFSGMAGELFSRVLLGPDGLILLINPDAVAPTALWVQMTRVEAEARGTLAMGDAVQEPSPELSDAVCPEVVAPLDMALPDALEEPVPDLGFDAVADLAAGPEVCDGAGMETPELSDAVSPEAEAPLDMALPDALEEEPVPDLGFDAVADLAAGPEVCDGAVLETPELSDAVSPEAVAPLDMAFPGALEEPVPDLGFDAVADLAAGPEVCDGAGMEPPELSEAASPAHDTALPDAQEEAAPDLGFDAMADPAAEPEACDAPEVDVVELPEPASDLGLDAVADLADKADGCEGDGVTTGQGCFVYVEPSEGRLSDEQEAPLDLVVPDEAAECVDETCQHEAADAGVESSGSDAGVGAEAPEVPCPDAGLQDDDEPVIDLVAPFPEGLVQAVEAEASARLQENDTLSSLMEKAITPDLLERVVDRVVSSMITELVSDLTSGVADSQKDQETSPLY